MITIDLEKCVGCGACAKDCPGRAIRVKDGKAEYTRECIHCGHCVAICPTNAVAIPGYDMEDVENYQPEGFTLDADTFLHAVKFRRSIRNFKAQTIEKETWKRILNAGRYTATAKNLQDCTFVVVQDQMKEFKSLVWQEIPKILTEIEKTAPDYLRAFTLFYRKWQHDPKDDTFFFNCTAFLVIASHNPLDGGLAAANMENMAVAEGLGTLYSGYMMRVLQASPTLREWLGIGDKPISCCMLLGYPAVEYKRTAPRKKADIVWK